LVPGDLLSPDVIDGEFTVETDTDGHPLAAALGGLAVALTPHANVDIPTNAADVVVTGIEVRCWLGPELISLFLEALSWRLPGLAQYALTGIAVQPPLQ